MTTRFNALTQVDVSTGSGSVTVIITVVIGPMNYRTAVSNVNLAHICCLFC